MCAFFTATYVFVLFLCLLSLKRVQYTLANQIEDILFLTNQVPKYSNPVVIFPALVRLPALAKFSRP